MSYLALARKYRPRHFADVLGQEHVVRALSHALDADRLHPAILLTGTRGVGKTTLGRIIAKGLNCDEGVSATPCGRCAACLEVDEGRCVDLIEIDAASRTKVDDTRALLDNVAYAPVRGRYKVYLIDEVHMLSNASFNALLKTLEEPPPHVKFILATTDPQKLPVTVLSRCLQFSLKRLPVAMLRGALAQVLEKEGMSGEPAALAELARAADGSMRDALSLLDQGIAYAGGAPIDAALVEQMLGGVGRHELYQLLAAVAAGDGSALVATLRRLEAAAPDYAALLDTVAGILQRLAVLDVLPEARDEDDDPALLELCGRLPAADLQLDYEIAVHARRDLPWAPDPRTGFEMALLRMLAFRPAPGGGGAGAGDGPARAAVPPAARPAAARPSTAPPAAAPTRASHSGTPADAPAPATSTAATSPASVIREPPAPPAAKPPATKPPAAPRPAAPAVAGDPSAVIDAAAWVACAANLEVGGLARQLLRHCAWQDAQPGQLRLCVPKDQSHLLTEPRRLEIETALVQATGASCKLEVLIGEPQHESLERRERAAEQAAQRAAQTAIDRDPVIAEMRSAFGATVDPESVRPRGASDRMREERDGP